MDNILSRFPALLIGCVVALLPLYIRISSVDLERVSKSNALVCLFAILLLLFTDKVRTFPSVLKLVFVVAIFHMIIFQYEPAAIRGIYQVVMMCFGALFLVKYHECHLKKDNHIIFNSMCIGALIQTFLGAMQYFNIDLYSGALMFFNEKTVASGAYVDGHKAIFGSLQNPNVFGAYLVLCLPAFFRSNKLAILAIPVFAILVLCESQIPIAAGVLSVAYFLSLKFKNYEKYFYISFPIAFYSFCFLFPDKTSERVNIWNWYLDKVDTWHFFLGKSASWIQLNAMRIRVGYVDNVHNDFLTLFNIFGIFSIVVCLYVLYLVVSNKEKDKIFATSLFGSFVIMHGSFPMSIASTSFLTLIALAHCIKGNYVSNVDW